MLNKKTYKFYLLHKPKKIKVITCNMKYEIHEEEYSKVVYGDSVSGRTPVVLRYPITQDTVVEKIEDCYKHSPDIWKDYNGFKLFQRASSKEYVVCNMEIMTHLGWKMIKKIIRHKTNKPMYRVSTTSGIVETTEDHSLITLEGEMIKPMELKPGKTVLLYSETYRMNGVDKEYRSLSVDTQLEAQKLLMGMKYDGSVEYDYKTKKYILSNKRGDEPSGLVKSVQLLPKTTEYVYDIETEAGTFSAGIGTLVVKNTDSCMIELKTKSYEDYKACVEKYKHLLTLDEIQKNEINTLKTKVIEESFKEGKELSKNITDSLFKKPIELEFEKVYHPFIILSKKRYIGNYYGTSPYKIDKVEKKGVVLTRRDNADIVKRIYNGVINPILSEGSRGINISIDFLKKQLQHIIDGNVDLNELVITKTLAKGYGKPCTECDHGSCGDCINGVIFGNSDYKQVNSPHITLSIKMRKRDPGSAPNVNDRISYVFIDDKNNPNAKLYDKAEELSIVIDKKLKIDALYYIENQIRNPVSEILKFLVADIDQIFDEYSKELKRSRKDDIKLDKIKKSVPKGQPSILKFIGKK